MGGLAGIVHGAARVTYDVDVVYDRSRENLRKLVRCLAPLKPYLRGVPPGLPFSWDEETLRNALNFTLTTALGDLDLFGETAGGWTYNSLLPYSLEAEGFGVRFRCVDLPMLIRLKRAAARRKDIEAIAELEALLAERQDGSSGSGETERGQG